MKTDPLLDELGCAKDDRDRIFVELHMVDARQPGG